MTVANALNTSKIVFTPKKAMRDAANSVELSIDRNKVTAAGSGNTFAIGHKKPGFITSN